MAVDSPSRKPPGEVVSPHHRGMRPRQSSDLIRTGFATDFRAKATSFERRHRDQYSGVDTSISLEAKHGAELDVDAVRPQ